MVHIFVGLIESTNSGKNRTRILTIQNGSSVDSLVHLG